MGLSDTPEPLSDEEIAGVRQYADHAHQYCRDCTVYRNTLRLLDEHARLKATVERVRAVRARFSYAAAVPGDFVAQKLDEALSPDTSTTETKR